MKSLLNAKCPQCGHFFELNESLKQEVREQMKQEALEWKARKEEEFNKREQEQQQHLKTLLQEQEQQLTRQITQRLSFNYENEIKSLKDTNTLQNDQLKLAQQRELDL
jgi:DNA anti-recombination protein RmuC